MKAALLAISIFLFISNPLFSQPPRVIEYTGNGSFCQGSVLKLEVKNTPIGTTFQWVKDGADVPAATGASYDASAAGSYTVRVTEPGNPTETTAAVIVTENTLPAGDFNFNANNACSGTTIQFTSTATGTAPFTYLWTFGDASTSTDANPAHSFIRTGCSTAALSNSLVVTDANGCSTTIAHPISVLEKPDVGLADQASVDPFSNCGNSPTPANANYALTVTNISSSAACITSYTINWGDGNTQSSLTNASFPLTHTYTQLGLFVLSITGTSTNGCSNTQTYTVANQSNPAGGLGTNGSTTNLCAPAAVPFVISNWIANSPGTVYVLNFGDGTSQSFNHPLNNTGDPFQVTHTYTTSSCPANSFIATLTVTNACSSTPYTAGNIQIRIKPVAAFTSPSTTACVNKPACFTNTSAPGYFGNGCTPAQNFSWDFGDPASGAANTAINTNGCHTYTTPGTYTIKMQAANGCGNTEAIQTVCVVPEPVPSFTLDNTSGCGPLNVTATNTSNTTSGCATPVYNWTVSYTATNCGTAGLVVFTNGTTASSLSPSFTFTNPGRYTIRLSITNACGTFSTTQDVTVKRPPTVAVNAISSICSGASINPTATVSTCGGDPATYEWTFTGGTPASSAAASPGAIAYTVAGDYTVTLKATNECGATTDSRLFTVKPVPVITIPAADLLCTGVTAGPYTFSSNMPGALSWTNNNTSIGLGSSGAGNTINAFTTTNSTISGKTATITVQSTAPNNCSASNSFDITVYPKVDKPVVISPLNYCKEETAPALSATALPGNTLLWYSASSGGAGSTTAPTPATTVPGTFDTYVSQVAPPASCESPRELIRVIVNPIPSFTAVANNPSQCGIANGSIILSGLAANTTYTIHYTKNTVPVNSSGTSTATGVINIGGLSPGDYDQIMVTALGCTSPAAGPYTLTDPNSPATPVAVNNGPLCSGKIVQLTASTTSSGTPTWAWTGPGGYTSNTANPSISNAPVSAAGTYTVTVTISNCTSAPASTTVVINPSPAVPVAGNNSPVCSGNTLNLTSTSSTGASYAWTGPAPYTSTDLNPTIPNAPVTANGTYTVTATLGSCTEQASTQVIVNPTPMISNATATDPATCSSATGVITLNGLSAGTSYTVNYTKNGAAQSAVIIANASGDVLLSNLTAGVYDNIIVAASNCQSNQKGPFTLTDPTPPATPVINNDGPKCEGQTLSLSANTITNATYTWSGPNSFTSNLQNPSITSVTTAAAGIYNVTVKVNGCSSPVATTTAIIHPTPVITNITGTSPVCTGNTIQFSATTGFGNAFTWSWTGPNSFSASIANPSITSATPAAAGMYSVTATAITGSCQSAPKTIVITVNTTPAIGSATKADPTACGTSTGSISLNGLAANTSFTVSYQYNTVPVTRTIVSNGTGAVVITNLAAGLYEHITVSTQGCASNEAGPFTLADPNPPATPVAGSNSPLCQGGTLQLTAATSTPGAISYTWSGPNGFTSTQQQPSIIAITPAGAGSYSVKATLNNCTSAAATVNVIVNPSGATPTVTTPVAYCKDETALPLSVTPAAGNTLNWYTLPAGGTASPAAPTPITATPGTTSYYVSQTTAAGCEGARAKIDVIIHPDASAAYNFTKSIDCAPFLLTAAVIQPVPAPARNSNYEWYANNIPIGTGTSFPGYTLQQPGDSIAIKLKAISAFGCKNDSVTHQFFTVPTPAPAFTVNTNSGCGPLSVTFNNTTPNASQFNFKWNFGNGTTSTSIQPGTVVFQPNPAFGDTTYKVTLSVSTICETITVTQNILVKSPPKALFTPAQPFGCSPFANSFVNTSKGNNLSFTWNFDDGTIVSTNQPDAQQHTFTTGVQDTFHVQLQATNECGTDIQSYAIVVSPNKIKLNLGINGNERTGCQPLTVHFINNTSGANSFHWDFGDGALLNTTKNIDTVTHLFLLPGSFTVTLQASNGCSDTTTTRTIEVFKSPKADFSMLPNPACVGETIAFRNLTDAATGISWRFGDGFTSNAQTPSHAFATAGSYPVTLIATLQYSTGNSCVDSITKPVQVGPSGSFSYDHGYVCGNTPVRFEVVSPDAVQVSWQFGDGQSQTTSAKIIYHSYSQAGNYIPVATLIQNGNCSLPLRPGDTIKVDYVQAGFITRQQRNCGNTVVTFSDTSRALSGIKGWSWNFGNGQTAAVPNPAITYIASNDYFVQQTVTAASGCTASFNTTLPVKMNNRPQSSIDAATRGCQGQPVNYRAIVNSTDPVTQYRWLFSDNGTATGQEVQYTYALAGNFTAQLISGTSFGCYDTVSAPIQVFNSPVVKAGADQAICKGKTYPLLASGASSYSWTPQDGSLSCTSCANPVAQPQSTTQYVVQGSNTNGCSTQDTILITVAQPIHIQAGNNDTICTGQQARLSVTGATRYQWTPAATLQQATSANPLAAPLFTTTYQVIGFDAYQCFQDTAYTVIAVGQYPRISLGPDTLLTTGTQFPLNSTVTNGPIKQWLWKPSTDLTCNNCALPVATIKNNTCYTATATTIYGCSASDTVCIRVFCEGTQVYIPNLFTPDNDGHNDKLIVRGKGIVRVKSFRIFNRWGQVVFERSNFPPNDAGFGWDGTVKGVPASPDVYVYTCDVVCENGTPYTYKGNVAIVK